MNRKLISLAAAFAVLATPLVAAAQAPAPQRAQQRAVGPTVAAAKLGVRAPTAARASTNGAAKADAHMGAGQNVALMVVGGAAIIVGSILGGAGGILLAIAGAAVGLYGLYNFIQ